MKLDIGSLSYDPTWYDFATGEAVSDFNPDGAYLQVRPVPVIETEVLRRGDDLVIDGKSLCKIFKRALMAWKGFAGPDGKPLPDLTDDIKQKIYDFQLGGIPAFVDKKCVLFSVQKEADEKNS